MSLSELFTESVSELVEQQVKSEISEQIRKICSEAVADTLANRTGEVAESIPFRRQVYDLIDRILPTSIGNHLRCGCYEEGIFREVFNKHINEEMRKEISAKQRQIVTSEMKVIVREHLMYLINLNDTAGGSRGVSHESRRDN